jgi:hypothetical protein
MDNKKLGRNTLFEDNGQFDSALEKNMPNYYTSAEGGVHSRTQTDSNL